MAIGVGYGVPVIGQLGATGDDFQDPAAPARLAADAIERQQHRELGAASYPAVVVVRAPGDVRRDARGSRAHVRRVVRTLKGERAVLRVVDPLAGRRARARARARVDRRIARGRRALDRQRARLRAQPGALPAGTSAGAAAIAAAERRLRRAEDRLDRRERRARATLRDRGARLRRLERTAIAADGRTVLLPIDVRDGGDVEAREQRLARLVAPMEARIGGSFTVQHEIGRRVESGLARAEMIAFPLLLLLSLWVFRGMVAALLPPMVGAVTVLVTFIALRLVNELSPITIYAVNLVTGIGLGLAIDYSLFIVSRWREEGARHGYGAEAMRRTMATAGRTILFSGVTVALAISSLLVFPLPFLRSMGIGGSIAALVGVAVSLTLLPAVLLLLGARIDALSPRWLRRAADHDARPDERGRWYRFAAAVMRRPGLVAVLAGGLLIACALPAGRVHFISADERALPGDNPARIVTEDLRRAVPEGSDDRLDVVVRAPRPAVRRYARRLADTPGVRRIAGVRGIGDGRWRVPVQLTHPGASDAALRTLDRLRALEPPGERWIGGRTAAFDDQQASLVDHLPEAAAILTVTTLVLLFLFTGSVVLPIKTLIMNLLTIGATFGLLVLIFQDGRLQGLLAYTGAGGLESTQPVLLCAIAFGLATDYGVFLLSRIAEARRQGLGEREAVAAGVERTARIVTAAALLFCVTIATFATADVSVIKQMSIGTGLAVAIDATIVRAMLVPALMALLGRWNWWAPRPLRALHRRLGVGDH